MVGSSSETPLETGFGVSPHVGVNDVRLAEKYMAGFTCKPSTCAPHSSSAAGSSRFCDIKGGGDHTMWLVSKQQPHAYRKHHVTKLSIYQARMSLTSSQSTGSPRCLAYVP